MTLKTLKRESRGMSLRERAEWLNSGIDSSFIITKPDKLNGPFLGIRLHHLDEGGASFQSARGQETYQTWEWMAEHPPRIWDRNNSRVSNATCYWESEADWKPSESVGSRQLTDEQIDRIFPRSETA